MLNELKPHEAEIRAGYNRWMSRATARAMAGRFGFLTLNTPIFFSWRRLGLRSSDQLFDIGCGSGTLLAHLASRVKPETKWFGVDLSDVQLQLAKERIRKTGWEEHISLQQGSGAVLPFPDASFDVVITSHVLHHVPAAGLPALFAEIRRVLRPGGRYLSWAFVRGETEEKQRHIVQILARARSPEEVMRQMYFHTESTVAEILRQQGFTVAPLPLGVFWLPPVPRFSFRALLGGPQRT